MVDYGHTWCRLQNWKCITYHNAARDGLSRGHEQHAQKIWLQFGHLAFSASLSVNIASVNILLTDLSPIPSVSLCVTVCQTVCLSVRKVYSGKTVEWIRMPFGMVSGVD